MSGFALRATIAAAALAALLAAGFTAMAQGTPIFRAPDPDLARRVALDAVEAPPEGLTVSSPYGAWTLAAIYPDFTQDGPWSTRFVISPADGRGQALQLTIDRHADLEPVAAWINEEVVHVRVWWSRFAGSDLLLDVGRRELIYHRMFFFPSDLPS